MINVTIHGIQQAQEALKKQIEKLMTDKTVLVGIHESSGEHEGGISNAQLGAVLHFGGQTGKGGKVTIPPRPWLDAGVQSGVAEYAEIIESHGDDLDSALELIGVVAVGRTQEYMTNLSTPENADSTKKKKGSANPLIDTGNLRQSVTYSTTNIKPEEGIG